MEKSDKIKHVESELDWFGNHMLLRMNATQRYLLLEELTKILSEFGLVRKKNSNIWIEEADKDVKNVFEVRYHNKLSLGFPRWGFFCPCTPTIIYDTVDDVYKCKFDKQGRLSYFFYKNDTVMYENDHNSDAMKDNVIYFNQNTGKESLMRVWNNLKPSVLKGFNNVKNLKDLVKVYEGSATPDKPKGNDLFETGGIFFAKDHHTSCSYYILRLAFLYAVLGDREKAKSYLDSWVIFSDSTLLKSDSRAQAMKHSILPEIYKYIDKKLGLKLLSKVFTVT